MEYEITLQNFASKDQNIRTSVAWSEFGQQDRTVPLCGATNKEERRLKKLLEEAARNNNDLRVQSQEMEQGQNKILLQIVFDRSENLEQQFQPYLGLHQQKRSSRNNPNAVSGQEAIVRRAALNPETLEKSFAFILGLLRDIGGANATDVEALISESQGSSQSSRRSNVLEHQTETYLNAEPALTVLDIGFPPDRVKSAIRKKVERTGLGFSNSDDIIEAILNGLQEETTSLNVIYKLY